MAELTYISTQKLFSHPDNPRKEVGDLSELADSIKMNGILQNLTVVPKGESGYTVIIGHRRLAAAKLAGLESVPCVVAEMTAQEQLKTMLMENIQRSDLTVYEQAQGFQLMLDMGETVESIARTSGFSQSTVRRRVKLMELDAEKFQKSEARGASLKDYMELDKIDSLEAKNEVLDTVGTANFHAALQKAIKDQEFFQCMKQWEKEISRFALKIETKENIGTADSAMLFVRSYGRWTDKNTSVQEPKDAGNTKYFYRIFKDYIELYRERQTIPKAETEIESERRKEDFKRVSAELSEITERHFALRMEFIESFEKSKKYMSEICSFAVKTIIGTDELGRDDVDIDIMSALFDLDIENDIEYSGLLRQIVPDIAENPLGTLLSCAYAASDCEDNGYWREQWDSHYQTRVYAYEENESLNHLYDFLISLGYEMSDEEKAMQDGSHPLFQKNMP